MAQQRTTQRLTGTRISRLQLGLGAAAVLCIGIPLAVGYDGPPDDDPSHWTDLVLGTDPHDGPEHMNEGAFEGGATGTKDDATANNSVPDAGEGDGKFRIPTGGKPSPLFGAESFTQQMLRFEEFGNREIPTSYDTPRPPFPPPFDSDSCPDGPGVDAFLAADLAPEPRQFCDEEYTNSWQAEIEAYVGHTFDKCVGDARPPGEGWSVQRYDEFAPVRYFESVQTGARVNGGLRDDEQLHTYTQGEFGPLGLYHNTTGLSGFEGTTEGLEPRFHPDMPIQTPQTLWTFDGTFPPKLLSACYGNPILFRHWNGLPIDIAANRGFGCHTLTTHEHNGHNPAESDGYANAFFFPGQYYDYNWPMILAGNDTINTEAADPRAGFPDGNGGIVNVPGDYRETMSTHWFHDHMLDFTAQNVYKGNAAMMNYYSSMDRGNEGLNDGVNLRLPSGSALDWGNRDYDVNLVIAGKAWDQEGQLWYNPFQTNGMLGDVVVTNWLYNPYFDVRARRYRFRVLNGSVARYFKFAVVVQRAGDTGAMPGPEGSGVSYDRVPFHMIANDGNIMAHAIAFDGTLGTEKGVLPTQGIGERYDIVVDFSNYAAGDRLYMVNLLEHRTGKRPEDAIMLRRVLSEKYKAVAEDDDRDGIADSWTKGDPTVTRFLEFRVHDLLAGQVDQSIDLAEYEPGKNVLITQPEFTDEELASARTREFTFGRSSGTDELPWTIKTNDGAFGMDPRRISAAPNINDVEIWTLTTGGGWSHPVHVHFEEGKILSRGGNPPPIWEQYGRKDIYRIGHMEDSGKEVVFAIRFRDFNGTYMEHCHNTTHEDTAMLLRWDIEFPGQVNLMPSPLPSWSGCNYVDSFGLNNFRLGDGGTGSGDGEEDDNPPIAADDFAQTVAPAPVLIHVTENDFDQDRDLDPETVVVTQNPSVGNVEVLSGGWVRYTPNVDLDTTDTFDYTVSDQEGNVSNAATVSVNISSDGGGDGGDNPPVAVQDAASTPASSAVQIHLTANDFDLDGDLDPDSVSITQDPGQGTVDLLGGGWVRYTPTVTVDATDTFNYTVADIAGHVSNTATVSVTITADGGGGDTPPVAVQDAASTLASSAVQIHLTANDFDVDGDLDPESVLITQDPGQGTVDLLGGGWVRYTPTVTVDATDTFNYTVADIAGHVSNTATVSVTITTDGGGGGGGGGSAPVAHFDQVGATVGQSVELDLTANDYDIDGDLDPSSLTITGLPGKGTVEVLADGRVRYTPTVSNSTTDSFVYVVSDLAGNVSNGATVQVDIGADGGGSPPRAIFDTADAVSNGTVDIHVTLNDLDADDDIDPDSVSIVQSPGHGTVQVLGGGWVRYTAEINVDSSDAFSYTVSDLKGNASNNATVRVTIDGDG